MRYPINLTPADEGGFVVTFPDVPEAITQGESHEDALANGLDALITSLDFYFEDQRSVPLPKRIDCGQETVELPASVLAKVLLLNEMVASQLRPIDLANRLGIRKQEVNRLLDLHHATKIDRVADALKAVGKRLELQAI